MLTHIGGYMINSRQFQIISFMAERKQAVTSSVLAQKLGVSQRTIKQELQLLKSEMGLYGFHITAKKGLGFLFEVQEKKLFDDFMLASHSNRNMTTYEERNCILLCILLTTNTLLHLQELEDMMYCNRNTILQSIKSVDQMLLVYDLKLKSSNKGYQVNGKEYHKRICIHNLLKKKYPFIQNEFAKYNCDLEHKKKITAVVITCLHEEDEKAISKVSIDEIVEYLYLFHMRNKEGYFIELTEDDMNLINEFPITYHTSKKIITKLESACHLKYQKEDIIFLLILLMSYRISNISFAKDSLRKELQRIAEQCLMYIHQKMGITKNLKDEELCMNIVRYLRSFQIRNRYKVLIRMDNISYVNIRRNFLPALDMSYYCLEYLYNRYGYIINEDEILYLTPSFVNYQYLIKNQKEYRALVISSSGIMFGNLIAERLKRDYNDYIQHLEVKEYYLINDHDLENIDIIISDLSEQELNIKGIPICQINGILESAQDRIKILYFLSSLDQLKLIDMFCEEQLLTQWAVSNKNEVFFQLVNLISDHYPVFDKTMLLRELVKRESVFSCESGNNAGICLLYDDKYEKERLFVIVFKRPILWRNEIVQILFVFCFNRKKYENYLFVLNQISKLLQDYDMLSHLINHQDFQIISSLI